MISSAGAYALRTFKPKEDAEVVKKLTEAQAIPYKGFFGVWEACWSNALASLIACGLISEMLFMPLLKETDVQKARTKAPLIIEKNITELQQAIAEGTLTYEELTAFYQSF
jgi:hypothetical protein